MNLDITDLTKPVCLDSKNTIKIVKNKDLLSFHHSFMEKIQKKLYETAKNQQDSPKKIDTVTIDFNLGDIFSVYEKIGYTQSIVGTIGDSSETFDLKKVTCKVTVQGFDSKEKKFKKIIVSFQDLLLDEHLKKQEQMEKNIKKLKKEIQELKKKQK